MLSICLVPNLNDLVVNTIIESWLVCTGHTSDTTYIQCQEFYLFGAGNRRLCQESCDQGEEV